MYYLALPVCIIIIYILAPDWTLLLLCKQCGVKWLSNMLKVNKKEQVQKFTHLTEIFLYTTLFKYYFRREIESMLLMLF